MKLSKSVNNLLKDGENVLSVLKGNSYTNSSNPLVRLTMAIVRIFQVITGSPTTTSIVCTNKRLILEQSQKFLWVFDYSSRIVAVAPRGVMQTGYNFVRSWYIFKNHYLTLVLSGSEPIEILSKDGLNGVMDMLDKVEELREKVN